MLYEKKKCDVFYPAIVGFPQLIIFYNIRHLNIHIDNNNIIIAYCARDNNITVEGISYRLYRVTRTRRLLQTQPKPH